MARRVRDRLGANLCDPTGRHFSLANGLSARFAACGVSVSTGARRSERVPASLASAGSGMSTAGVAAFARAVFRISPVKFETVRPKFAGRAMKRFSASLAGKLHTFDDLVRPPVLDKRSIVAVTRTKLLAVSAFFWRGGKGASATNARVRRDLIVPAVRCLVGFPARIRAELCRRAANKTREHDSAVFTRAAPVLRSSVIRAEKFSILQVARSGAERASGVFLSHVERFSAVLARQGGHHIELHCSGHRYAYHPCGAMSMVTDSGDN